MNSRRHRSVVNYVMIRFSKTLAAAFLFSACLAAAERPNAVLIMTDDQGYGDFGATGNQVIRTPHLDAMAERSAQMATFYVSPVCSPTRASLMTGRYNYRTRCIDTYLGRSMMDPAEVTVAEMLRDAGYATGIFGKWHLGDNYPMRAQDQGFEESLVHRGGGLAQPSEPPENARRYTDPILFRNGEKIQTKGYCTDVYFDGALEFIEQAHDSDRPFFAYIATNAPHGPFHDVPEVLREEYMKANLDALADGALSDSERDTLARIAAMITNVDDNVARLFDLLEQLGLVDNTLVIFLVDNGPNTRRYVGPFRGQKTEVYEGGVRSPLWLHWPARLDAGVTRAEPAAHIDLMPTILEACGVAPRDDVRLDGRSLLPLLEEEDAAWPERAIAIQTHRGDTPVRYHNFMIREGRWKLLHASGFGREGLDGEPKFELYDIVADPGETKDRMEDEPEIAARLQRAYDAWFDDVSSTRSDNYAPPRIVIGTPHENPTVLTRQDWRGGTWAPNSRGHWLVTIAETQPYSFVIRFDPAASPATIELRVNDRAFTQSVESDAVSAEFAGLALDAVDATIEAIIRDDNGERGAYQITVSTSD